MYVIVETRRDGSINRIIGPCTDLTDNGQIQKYFVKNGYIQEGRPVWTTEGKVYSKVLGTYASVCLLETDPLREP